ncbi:hypothetical protein BU25DRAFT_457845 [Macroventuria anomochaeta]|uniref:Uncharacterized protein n=1 Tax=Macroventuria anomochaeta TaxID=301207 RepID=A0ACB6S327_9PLEO|nr:uncharacterized protein BU25DRAFT_457845 [Macroventuria anomochaeta]KAF2628541.1 hypothetical protein BU25DRAFT_457845 [Macroventuria anomochaeta]
MFSPALGRAFRSTSAITAVPTSSVGRAAISTAQQPFRPSHQRRLSSSKPSTPPDNSKRPTENAAEELKTSEKRSSRSSKLKVSSTSAPATAARNIPYVKPTDHLMEHHLVLSTLFSQHRPISISPAAEQSVPVAASMEQFEAIFQPQRRNESEIIVNTHKTLAEFIHRVQASADQYEAMDAFEEAAEEIYHLDSFAPAQPESLESYAFRPPPAPVPFDPLATEEACEITLPTTHTGRSKTFREHVRRRRSGMLLISVKRQRKLKMKKHKYKKLMKRTRLLRRKLDRL